MRMGKIFEVKNKNAQFVSFNWLPGKISHLITHQLIIYDGIFIEFDQNSPSKNALTLNQRYKI